ncbi:MAG: hypothetical protein EXS38_05255 [Opitutus sp.]|nr:hypothetical protein [Opitutus sp.]
MLAANTGFAPPELNEIHRHVKEHCQMLLTAYYRFRWQISLHRP